MYRNPWHMTVMHNKLSECVLQKGRNVMRTPEEYFMYRSAAARRPRERSFPISSHDLGAEVCVMKKLSFMIISGGTVIIYSLGITLMFTSHRHKRNCGSRCHPWTHRKQKYSPLFAYYLLMVQQITLFAKKSY